MNPIIPKNGSGIKWTTLWHVHDLRILGFLGLLHFLKHAGLQDLIFHTPDQFRCALDGQLMMDPLRTPQVCKGSLLGWKCVTESPLRLWPFNTFLNGSQKGVTWPFIAKGVAQLSKKNLFSTTSPRVCQGLVFERSRLFTRSCAGWGESALALARTKPDSPCEK